MNSPGFSSADPSISDDEEEMDLDDSKPKCSNCGILCHITHTTPKGNFCGTCHQVCIIIRVPAKEKLVKTIIHLIFLSYHFFQYWNRTGQLRPTTGPARKDGSKGGGIQKYNSLMKNNGKPPKGMYVNHDDLVSLATGPSTQGEQLLKGMDREIVSFKRIVSKIFIFSFFSFRGISYSIGLLGNHITVLPK